MPRLANAPSFPLKSLADRRILKLLGTPQSDSDERIEMLFLRLADDTEWHRMFLDAGIGFWEQWSEAAAFDDFDDFRLIDFSERWQLHGVKIVSAHCLGHTWTQFTSSKKDEAMLSSFEFITEAGVIQLAFVDPNDMESDTSISFKPINPLPRNTSGQLQGDGPEEIS